MPQPPAFFSHKNIPRNLAHAQFGENITQARAFMGQHVGRNLAMDELDDVQSLQMIKLPRNRAVALVCRWVVAHLAYQDAQLLLEESAGEAAFELKDHELSQHRGLHVVRHGA